MTSGFSVAPRLELTALPGIPIVEPGDDLGAFVRDALGRAELRLEPGDLLVVTSKLFSRAEGCFVDLGAIEIGAEARALAVEVDKDPALVELILRESVGISRKREGALIVRHRLGFVSANAAIDASNAAPASAAPNTGPWALTMPEDPDASARTLLATLDAPKGVGVVVSDSHGRPFRHGTVGACVGVAGVPALIDQRGGRDLHGRELQFTITALADQVAAAADLVAGQSDEGRPVVHVRGILFPAPTESVSAAALLRDPDVDLYA